MKTVIVYYSQHHGNTKKLLDAIAAQDDVTLMDVVQNKDADLSSFDRIGFASGIYAARFHQDITAFAQKNLPQDKKIFYIMTSAMNRDFSKSMDELLKDKHVTVAGRFSCKGYNTFGPFKLIGGTGKGHPDETDLRNAVAFYKGLIGS